MSWPRSMDALLPGFLESLFGSADAELLRELPEQLGRVALKAGETLFHQNDPADALYIVLAGRLRVVVTDEDVRERVISEVGRGETVGELALLTDDPRSATVFAVRDTELARLPRTSFLRFLEGHPRFLLGLTRTTVERLRRQSHRARVIDSVPSSLALVATDPSAPLHEFTSELAAALLEYGPVAVLGSADLPEELRERGLVSRLSSWLQDREDAVRFVLYRADPSWSEWTDLCTRQADRVILVGHGEASPRPGAIEQQLIQRGAAGRAPRQTLVLVHERELAPGTARWLAGREVDEHLHVRRGSRADHARVARSLVGEGVGLVLGGGGARGLAHIGVIRALQELQIPIDFIGGTSIGAVIAALYAVHGDWQAVLAQWRSDFRSLRDYTWPYVALTRGARLNLCLRSFRGHQIEDLRLPCFAVAANLSRAEQVVRRSGSLFDAVRASVSLPGVFPPCLQPTGDYHVDGGLLNNVPVDVMRRITRNGPVIGVDVSPDAELEPDPRMATEVSGWKLLRSRFTPFSRRSHGPGIFGLLLRSTLLGCIATRHQTQQQADLYLELPLGGFGVLEFGALDALVARGYESSIESLRVWQETPRGRGRQWTPTDTPSSEP